MAAIVTVPSKEMTSGNSAAGHTSTSPRQITLRISRCNPAHGDDGARFDDFTMSYEKWTTVLDAILEVKNYLDHSVAVRYSCRQASCGSCGMIINGKPRLACFTKISELDSDVVTVQPMKNFPVIRDLAVSFEKMFAAHRSVKPYMISDDADLDEQGAKEHIQLPEQLDQYIQFTNCIKCGLCNSACPTMATDSKFVGPQALAQAYRYVADSRDQGKSSRLPIIDESHGIWRCHFAGSCSQVCPKGVDPAMGIQMLRGYMLGFKD